MESISRDARAFQELADEDNSQKDFSKFSKLELPASVIIENSVSTFPVKLCKAINMSTESEKLYYNSKTFYISFKLFMSSFQRRRKGSIHNYLSRSLHGGLGLGSRRISRKPTALTHDLAVFLL